MFRAGPGLISVVSFFTAPLGARLAHRLPVATLKKIFAGVLILLSAKKLHTVFVADQRALKTACAFQEGAQPFLVVLGAEEGEGVGLFLVAQRPSVEQAADPLFVPAGDQRRAVADARAVA
jgi:hypothetical protein